MFKHPVPMLYVYHFTKSYYTNKGCHIKSIYLLTYNFFRKLCNFELPNKTKNKGFQHEKTRMIFVVYFYRQEYKKDSIIGYFYLFLSSK